MLMLEFVLSLKKSIYKVKDIKNLFYSKKLK